MKIIIRADSSTAIGSGHVMRCLVLADELRANIPVTIIFVCRNLSGAISAIINDRGYKTEIISADMQQANIDFLNFLQREKPELLVIDNYDMDISVESQARQYVKRILVIDDLANRQHDCDILLDQNPCSANHAKYSSLVPVTALKLFGLKYALLGAEFAKNKKILDEQKTAISNVLIFFGGGDQKNLTQMVLDALISAGLVALHFNIVVGSSNPHKQAIEAKCALHKNFTYYCQINNMATLMNQADLFIGAGGTTSWERLCIGLPGIVISVADNQVESCLELARMEVIKYLGSAEEFSAEKLINALHLLIEQPKWLVAASKKGQGQVDGYGAKKITTMLGISLVTAKLENCEAVFKWRNAPENRLYAINSQEITWETHKKWFADIINNNNHSLLIAYYAGEAIGVVRFDFIGSIPIASQELVFDTAAFSSSEEIKFLKDRHIPADLISSDDEKSLVKNQLLRRDRYNAEISLYLVPQQHDKGFGLSLLNAAEAWLRQNCQNIVGINAKIVSENEASRKIFSYAAYEQVGFEGNVVIVRKSLK